MKLSFFSCSRSVLLYSIIILGVFFIFGQVSITQAAFPVPLTPVYPPNIFTSTIPSGSVTFQWSYSGDTTNILYYFYMLKWDFNQAKWVNVAGEHAKANLSITKFITHGYYAWQVAAVDTTQSDPNNWYKYMNDWSKVHLYSHTPPFTTVPTVTPTLAPLFPLLLSLRNGL